MKLEFHGVKVTSDAGLFGYREIDGVFGLKDMTMHKLKDKRTHMEMSVKMIQITTKWTFLILMLTALMTAGSLWAAEIKYVGHQVGVEQDADDPNVGWRNPMPAKPLDIDGDNILGTDGWALHRLKSNPAYAWIKQIAPNANGGGSGKWDNPSDPSGPDTVAAAMLHNHKGDSVDAFKIVINGHSLKGKTLRLGVLYSVISAGKSTFTITQTLGGKECVTTPPIDYDGSALDAAFFDITDAADGDTFIISTRSIEGNEHVAGITFDTMHSGKVKEVVEPQGVVRTIYNAPFTICGLFSDNAVLQRGIELPVWGWDDPGTVVTVEFMGQKVQATTGKRGCWTARLQPLKISREPNQLVVSTEDEKFKAKNILVGDVWLCAGQSNMEMHFSDPFVAPRMPCDLPEFVKPADWPTIRHIRIVGGGEEYPQRRLPQSKKSDDEWRVCNDDTYKTFTATGFFFAYTVSKEMDVPIGLINIARGNTRIGSWVPPGGIELVKDHVPAESFRGVWGGKASALFYSKVSPIAGFGIKGMLWYQGEANGKEGESYFWKMKALIHSWRQAWGQGDVPFYFAQLPSYNGRGSWAPIREAQRKALTIPNTGMAVLTDAGDNQSKFPANLHPRNKFTVGRRLALWALAKDYGKDDLVYSGPLFKSAAFKDNKVVISFDHVGSGLMAGRKTSSYSVEPPQPVDTLKGFEIAAADKKWYEAEARIEGGQVILISDEVTNPAAARYLYTMNTDHGTLYNKEGLPASPFRTGDGSW